MKFSIVKLFAITFCVLSVGCNNKKGTTIDKISVEEQMVVNTVKHKNIDAELPVIGLLVYDGFLTMELTAPLNVFGKFDVDGKKLFNVVTVAEKAEAYTSEEGLQVIPDFTFENSPKLNVLIVPSAMNMETAVKNDKILNYIIEQNKTTQYTASNCAGAFLIGASGVANGKKIVTYVSGGELLQETFPQLLVQDDAVVSYMEDGKIISSNGNFSSYISAFNLLEKMVTPEHRKYVEEYLYLDRLKNW